MTSLSTLPTVREQALRVLTLLGAPTAACLVVEVHGALFDGDLSAGALVRLLRDEELTFGSAGRMSAEQICHGLDAARLTAARGVVALSTWPLSARIVTPTSMRVDTLLRIVRVAEFVAVRAGATGSATRLLRLLATDVPGGTEAYDALDPRSLADVARVALLDPQLSTAADADLEVRRAAAGRAVQLDERQRLFGVGAVPRQPSRRGSPG